MSTKPLSTLQIRLLFKCFDKAMSKSDIYRFYPKLSPKEREELLTVLAKDGLLSQREMPKKGANKIPIFYFITDKGREWVENYQANYPE